MIEYFENWKEVPGYETFYEVSDWGRIRSLARRGTTGRVLAPSLNYGGYALVVLSKENRPRTLALHVLVALAFLGPRPKNKQVNHKDANKLNNMLWNLEYVTASQNIRHAIEHGVHCAPKGEKHGRSKLTQAQVNEIRRLYTEGMSGKQIAKSFGISESTAYRIIAKRLWRALE